MGSKVTRSADTGKGIRLLDGERAFVGVDVHKKSYSVCLWTEERGAVASWVQPARPAALAARLEPIRAQVAWVVYEAGPTGYGLVRHLRAAEFPADVIAPSKTPSAPGRSGKGDRRDAAQVAFLAAKRMLTAITVPTPEEEADRQVVRRRNQLARELRRTKHRIKSFLLQHGLPGFERWSRKAVEALRTLALGPGLRWSLDSLLADYDHLRAQLKAADGQVAQLARTERHAAAVELVCHVPGVGPTVAMTVRTEVLHPERFEGPEQVASFTGLAPCVRQSGERTRSGPILKTGNRFLRCLLVEAAWQWVRHDPAAKALYRHLVAATASPNKAVVGVARHLVILLWRILTTGAVYTPPPAVEDGERGEPTAQP
jgi:transposase